MDFKRILNRGYSKLLDYLPETDKEFIHGFSYAIEQLENFKENIDDFIEDEIPTIAKIEKEIAEIATDNAVKWLEDTLDEIKVGFVDNNHYSIDENGVITDDGE